jgi:ketosteroid isomerase-like protein
MIRKQKVHDFRRWTRAPATRMVGARPTPVSAMSRLALAAFVLSVVTAPVAFAQEAPKPAPAQTFSAEECAVWAREQSFADTVEKHDAKAFADHVNANAVFSAKGPRPQRGRDTVVSHWAKIIDGTALRIAWYPTSVVIGGDGDIAYSSGRALLTSPDPKDPQRYALTRFQSVWHRDADGVWRVLFDDGEEPKPATEADVAAFHAGRKPCPRKA